MHWGVLGGCWGWGAPIRVREEFRSTEGEMKGEGCLLPYAYGRAVHALGGGFGVGGSPTHTGGLCVHREVGAHPTAHGASLLVLIEDGTTDGTERVRCWL